MSHGLGAWGSDLPGIRSRAASLHRRRPGKRAMYAPRNAPSIGGANRTGRARSGGMKIYGHPMSTCTRKVLMTLLETNTSFDLEVVDFAKGEHKQEPHLSRQPFGQVPVLQDAGFELYESRAMCRYINDKAGGALVPRDLRDRARMEQWMSIETSDFTGAVMKFIFQHIFQRQQTPETLEAAGAQLDKALPVMDRQLASHPFIAGETFTLADICFMPYIEYGMGTPAKERFAKHPHVAAWWSKISERPTWRKVAGRAAA
jgi:glutathione S-transferase